MDLRLSRARPEAGRPLGLASSRAWVQPQLNVWLGVLFAGSAALGVWFLVGPAVGPGWYYKPGFGRGAYGYANQVLLLFVPYGLALWAWHRGARAPMWLIAGGAVVLHILVLFAPLPQSQDFYQYLFYGRMQAVHGANPMVVHPSQFTDDPWYFWIRWYSQPSVYGPVWTMVSFGVVKAAGESLAAAFAGLKLVILALDLAVMGMIAAAWRERGDSGRGAWGVLAYGWNPLILISVPLAGVPDVALAAAFLAALLARRRNHTSVATALLALASLVKIYAIFGLLLHIAFVARERGRATALRQAGAALAVAVLAYSPYWAGIDTFSGLLSTVDLTNVTLTGIAQLLLERGLGLVGLSFGAGLAEVLVRLVSGGLLLGAIAWAIRTARSEDGLWQGAVVVLAAYLYLTPWSFYWYTVVPVALVAALPLSRLTYPVITFSAAQLIVVRFQPTLAAWSVQTALRYGLPVLPHALGGRHGAEPRRQGAGASRRLPSTRAIPERAPAAR